MKKNLYLKSLSNYKSLKADTYNTTFGGYASTDHDDSNTFDNSQSFDSSDENDNSVSNDFSFSLDNVW
ncbi:hypothetical protein SAMN05192574_11629 [Mucilaginibacter gossypiicola]|uniref:Uncharacterized protein n=1 Tax=Mucilaginibacter gossypiicola TaxID=551995 RepID=A0A1H8TL56_9SPHI|nr:hypothetical protein SAMN05192574_11629 [Mucilaginibacter gossypiicola]